MPAPPVQPILDQIADMLSALKSDSCKVPENPLINFETGGVGPTIDFNIPQNTAFTTYGYLVKYIPVEKFKEFTTKAPENNFFRSIENMSAEQINQMLHQNVYAPREVGTFTPVATSAGAPSSGIAGRFTNSGVAGSGSAGGYSGAVGGSSTPASSRGHLAPGNTPRPSSLGFHDEDRPTRVISLTSAEISPMADYASRGLRPMIAYAFGNRLQVVEYLAKPPVPVPRIVVIEEYTTQSYLGNYGAGKVVKTMSLAPGERTTITVRTYKDMVSTRDKSQNVLDSFSEESASEFDQLMQIEQGNTAAYSDSSGGSGSNYATQSDSKNSSSSGGISGKISLFGVASIGGGYGRSSSETSTSSGGFANAYNYNSAAARSSNVETLNSALNKHVQQSNANRQVNVNSSTSDTARSGEEDTIYRELQNYNKSRTLNLVFRQLLQEYTTVTYLSNLKFAYTNGYAESYRVVDLNNLVNMLKDIIADPATPPQPGTPTPVEEVLCTLLAPYCSVTNWNESHSYQFVEPVTVTNAGACLLLPNLPQGCGTAPETYYRKKKGLEDTVNIGNNPVSLPGVILSVKKQTLLTASLIMDALLGRGEALDCFNKNAQAAENNNDFIGNLMGMQGVQSSIQNTANNQLFATQQLAMGAEQINKLTKEVGEASLENDVTQLKLDMFNGTIPYDEKLMVNFKNVFGDCCPTPQYTGGCGCGNCAEKP